MLRRPALGETQTSLAVMLEKSEVCSGVRGCCTRFKNRSDLCSVLVVREKSIYTLTIFLSSTVGHETVLYGGSVESSVCTARWQGMRQILRAIFNDVLLLLPLCEAHKFASSSSIALITPTQSSRLIYSICSMKAQIYSHVAHTKNMRFVEIG